MSYTHTFDMAFSVEHSEHEAPDDCLRHEKVKVLLAVARRLLEILELDELHEAFGEVDTYQEE